MKAEVHWLKLSNSSEIQFNHSQRMTSMFMMLCLQKQVHNKWEGAGNERDRDNVNQGNFEAHVKLDSAEEKWWKKQKEYQSFSKEMRLLQSPRSKSKQEMTERIWENTRRHTILMRRQDSSPEEASYLRDSVLVVEYDSNKTWVSALLLGKKQKTCGLFNQGEWQLRPNNKLILDSCAKTAKK